MKAKSSDLDQVSTGDMKVKKKKKSNNDKTGRRQALSHYIVVTRDTLPI